MNLANDESIIKLRGDSGLRNLPPVLWNRDEVFEELNGMLARYKGAVYTEEQMKEAKADRAAVNKIEKQLANAQKRVTDLYKAPVEGFCADMKALRAMTKDIANAIDAQVKAVEDSVKAEKRKALEQVYTENVGALATILSFERVFDPKWLNATVSIKKGTEELMTRLEVIRSEVDTVEQLAGEWRSEAIKAYLERFKIADAMAEVSRQKDWKAAEAAAKLARMNEQRSKAMAAEVAIPSAEKQKAIEAAEGITEYNRMAQPIPAVAEKEEVKAYDFRVWLTKEDVKALKLFFESRNIKYGKVK